MSRILGLLLLAPLLLLGCIGSTSKDAPKHADVFSLNLCSLGCSGTGNCATNQIATNQDLVFTFNDTVDASSVSMTALSLVDIASGSSPVGQFLVNDDTVIFRPALIESTSGVSFGFEEGAIYQMVLHSSPSFPVIKSVIDRPNTTGLSCSISSTGILDLVPGSPQVSITPSSEVPPTSSSFTVQLVFNDLMQRAQLLDDNTGTSPTISILVVDDTQASSVEVEVPGTWAIQFNQNLLTTTLSFAPLAPFPGGQSGARVLRVSVAGQVADLTGNLVANPGSYFIPLPERNLTPGSFIESFDSLAMEDSAESTASLWASPAGSLDSGLIPDTGFHRGGGSGVLGIFAPTADFVFNTDSDSTFVMLSGAQANITDGVFPFSAIQIPDGVTVRAIGLNPLRLFARGELVVDGVIDLSGANAPSNFGKHFPTAEERVAGESVAGISDINAVGGQPGTSNAGGGAGGTGGQSWYLFDGAGTILDPDYFDESLPNYNDPTLPADPNRFQHGIRFTSIHGQTGQGLGGLNGLGYASETTGNPEFNMADIALDQLRGGGIGTWAWPPASDLVPDDISFGVTTNIRAHQDPATLLWLNFSIHRARGGGGGGFWTDGVQGDIFALSSTDPLGLSLATPVVDVANGIYEYNDIFDFNERAGGGVVDGAGGSPDLVGLYPGIESLDPSLSLLLGGSGGGGAGASEHGSWSDDPTATSGFVDTYRSSSGAGGGAGGGALQLHAGDRLSITGSLQLGGGVGGDSDFMVEIPYPDPAMISFAPPGDAGGGGGSGGALLLQAGGSLTVDANVDEEIVLDGGRGGLGSAGNHGGAGGSGLARFETPTGTESLALLKSWVSPDAAVDLTPIGSPGLPNLVAFAAQMTGASGDLGAFDLNSSGVTSRWFEPSSTVFLVDYTSWTLNCEFDTGTGPQVVSFSSATTATSPGATPVWIAFQVGWGSPGFGQPDATALGDWVVPGANTVAQGLEELRSYLGRMIRFQLVFDQNQVAALIGADPSAYFRVTDLQLGWNGE